MKTTTYQIVTETVLNAMKTMETIPWRTPWAILKLRNAVSRRPYRGINVLLLSLIGDDYLFLTYKQASAMGGQVNKGAKGKLVTFFNWMEREQPTGEKKKVPFLRYYKVFGLNQTNLESAGLYARPEFRQGGEQSNALGDKLVASSLCGVEHGGNVASVNPKTLRLSMPERKQFKTDGHYYATLAHELGHWIGFTLDRENAGDKKVDCSQYFQAENYSKEELVAEMFSNYFLSYVGIDSSAVFENSISYLQNWLEKLGRNEKWLVQAMGIAQKRFDWLLDRAGLLENDTKEQSETVSE